MHTELYDRLGVTPEATAAVIKASYYAKARQHHPDVGGDPETFRRIQEAYDILSDTAKRDRYDANGITEEPRIDDFAREEIAKHITKAVAEDSVFLFRTDFVEKVKREIALEEGDLAVKRKTLEVKRATAGKLADRLKPKGERNIPKDIVGHIQRDIDGTLQKIANRVAILKRTRELIDEYEFETDEPPITSTQPVPSWFTTVTGMGGTGV